MLRVTSFPLAVILAVGFPVAALADAYGDLVKVETAFKNAKSYHAEEHFSNGRTTTVDYLAPDRWRIQPSAEVTELIVGDDVYMVSKGRSSKLPGGGQMMRSAIAAFAFSADDDLKQSARDLGVQSVDGQNVHAYSFVRHGTPATLYVGPHSLPVQSVVNDQRGTTIIKYSKYNEPISIEAPP